MPVCEDEADCEEALQEFLHEMGAEPTVQPKLAVTTSSLPAETTTVLLESRGKAGLTGAAAPSAGSAPGRGRCGRL